MTTIADIARETGFSTATVSNALTGKGRVSEARRQQILATARAMGYDFQRIRSAEPRRHVAVIVETLSTFFCVKIAEGVCRAARDAGYAARVYNLDLLRDNPDYSPPRERMIEVLQPVAGLMREGLSGLVYVSQYPRDLTGVMPQLSVPLIYAYCYTRDGAPSVNTDDQYGAILAVRHLLSLGKRRIAMVNGPINSIPMTQRLSGYQRALIDAGLSIDLKLITQGDWEVEHSRESMRELLSLASPPDGVFCQSDHIALGVCRAIRDFGLRIPEDIAIIGFDDYDFARFVTPSLTTIHQPFTEIGESAFSQLQRLIEKRGVEDDHMLIRPRLVRRESA